MIARASSPPSDASDLTVTSCCSLAFCAAAAAPAAPTASNDGANDAVGDAEAESLADPDAECDTVGAADSDGKSDGAGVPLCLFDADCVVTALAVKDFADVVDGVRELVRELVGEFVDEDDAVGVDV